MVSNRERERGGVIKDIDGIWRGYMNCRGGERKGWIQ